MICAHAIDFAGPVINVTKFHRDNIGKDMLLLLESNTITVVLDCKLLY